MADCKKHDWVESGRKPGTYKCGHCTAQFPCREDTCGHLDCIESRGKAPRCHFCRKIVTGPRGSAWTSWAVRGITRTVHYFCRDQHASPNERSRWGTL